MLTPTLRFIRGLWFPLPKAETLVSRITGHPRRIPESACVFARRMAGNANPHGVPFRVGAHRFAFHGNLLRTSESAPVSFCGGSDMDYLFQNPHYPSFDFRTVHKHMAAQRMSRPPHSKPSVRRFSNPFWFCSKRENPFGNLGKPQGGFQNFRRGFLKSVNPVALSTGFVYLIQESLPKNGSLIYQLRHKMGSPVTEMSASNIMLSTSSANSQKVFTESLS